MLLVCKCKINALVRKKHKERQQLNLSLSQQSSVQTPNVCVREYYLAQMWYTIPHIIFPHILLTIIIAQVLSIEGQE